VIDYLKAMDLEEYVEGFKSGDVVVLADSGYDVTGASRKSSERRAGILSWPLRKSDPSSPSPERPGPPHLRVGMCQ